MRKRLLIVSIAVALMLCACGDLDATPTEPTVPATEAVDIVETEPIISTEPKPISVRDMIVEDYLLPVDEFSWEREFEPEFIMIHFSSAIVNHPEDPYNIDFVRDTFIQYDVSTHYIIERDGTIRCYIPEDRVAWHAGAGEWNDDPKYTNKMNYYAIGIEVVAIGSYDEMSIFMTEDEYNSLNSSLVGYTQEQYDSIKLLVEDLCEKYHIPMDREHIIGHDEYSVRKTDPGELFDWSQIVPTN